MLTKKTSVHVGPSFSKEGEKVALGFRHVVNPEGIIDEPNRLNIYDKPGVVGADKKKTLPCLENATDNKLDVNVDRQKIKAKANPQNVSRTTGNDNDKKVIVKKINKTKNKTREEIAYRQRLGPVKRVPATHNFIFEFNPRENSPSTINSMVEQKEAPNTSNVVKEEPAYFKPNGAKSNSTKAQPQSLVALPKLLSQNHFSCNREKQENKINYTCDANLPVIGKQDVIGDKIDRTPISEIDRDVECVKSNWQALRSQKNWARSKDYTANARTRKLYETIEKVTREVDKIQRSYLHPKANQYLHRGAVKALEESPRLRFEDEAEKIKDLLFPKGNNRCRTNKRALSRESRSNDSNDMGKNSEKTTRLIRPSESVHAEKFVSKLTMCNSENMFLPDSCTNNRLHNSTDFYVNPLNSKSPFEDKRKTTTKIKSQINEYLDRYIDNTDKPHAVSPVINEDNVNLRNSTNDIAKMLEELKIHPRSFDESSEELSTDCDEQLYLRSAEEIEKPSVGNHPKLENKISGDVKKDDFEFGERVSFAKMGGSTRFATEKSCDTAIQADAMRNAKENIFAKIGFGGPNADTSENALSRILQSEYLRKDLSLYPM